jgi:cytochrome P450
MVLGRKWMTRRRILTLAFHFSILQQFDNIFNEETDRHVDIFKEIDDLVFPSTLPLLS